MTQISGQIYQLTNGKTGAELVNRFPRTVIEAVYGLSSYLQTQFSALADIYMPIEGITESKTGQEFVYRKSPATIKAKSLTLDRIYGKTLAWNQLSAVRSVNAQSISGAFVASNDIVAGHKYLCSLNITKANGVVFITYPDGSGDRSDSSGSMENGVNRRIIVGNGYDYSCSFAYADGESMTDIMCFDLTLLYGSEIDGMTDAQILAKFENEFPGYHSYNSGALISNDAESLETVGFNQWDEEWEVGDYDAIGTETSGTNTIRTKNYISIFPNTEYYFNGNGSVFEYDDNKVFIIRHVLSAAGTFTTGDSARFLRFQKFDTYGTTYNHDICINISDPAKNGTYEPYRKTTLQLGLNNFKVKSHNIWDEQWEEGSLNEYGQPVVAPDYIRSKNYCRIISGKDYYFLRSDVNNLYGLMVCFYDHNKDFVGYNYCNRTVISVPSGSVYFKIATTGYAYGTTYNHDICINVSSSFNGQYEPHGILTKTGGLKGKDSWRDEWVGNKLVQKANRVDLGSLDWAKDGDVFYANVYDMSLNCKSISSKYGQTLEMPFQSGDDKVLRSWLGSYTAIYVKDSSYSTASEFKTAMSGVMLDYELATPIEYELVEPLVYSMAAGTTEARISPNSDGLSAPFCCDMTYDANANNDSANAQYALTAGRLYNPHKLWGQDFDGSNDVSGALSGVTTIDASGNITTAAQLISTVATGTAPLSVASTTEVANLHSYTATKLHTQRTLWGQNFDGSGNVTGDMSSVGNIAFSASGKNIASLLYFDTTNSRVGVGASSPAYKLDVNGTLNASGNTTIGGTFTVGTSSVNKATTLYGALTASGAVSFTSTLGVAGLSTLAGGIKLTTTKKIWFGDTYFIALDANNHLYTNAGFYSTSFITAGGVGSGSGGGSNLVKERAYDISLTQIASSDYAELIRSPYISDSESGYMFAYSPAFLDTASQVHDYVIDAIGHEIGSCDIQWIGIAIGSTYTDVGVFDSGAFLVLAKSSNTYYWYEFEV